LYLDALINIAAPEFMIRDPHHDVAPPVGIITSSSPSLSVLESNIYSLKRFLGVNASKLSCKDAPSRANCL
jgi:hypothetical protein